MLTIIGLGVIGAFGTGVAAKFGLVNYELDKEVMGHSIHLEFNKQNPIKFAID